MAYEPTRCYHVHCLMCIAMGCAGGHPAAGKRLPTWKVDRRSV